MLNRLIEISLSNRGLVLILAALVLILGGIRTAQLPVDVFPDLSAPTVTVLTEGVGMAPEEMELLVTFPLESALNGAPGVRRVRSISAAGISVLWVEFEWGQDIFRARQIVGERLQEVELSERIEPPVMGPISSIMGEIAFLAMTAEPGSLTPMELRTLAETVVRRSLLSIPGVSQVSPIGGEVREFQVVVRPEALAQYRISLNEVLAALEAVSAGSAAGFHVDRGEEFLVRGLSRARDVQDLSSAVIRAVEGVPVRVSDVAQVRVAPAPLRGTAAYNMRPAVILSVQKQPDANTLDLTRKMDLMLDRLEPQLPPGVTIQKESFRQSYFIERAIHNVSVAMRDGALLVIFILFLFLGNLRTTIISVLSIPLSLLVAVLVISWFGGTLNTMTLGGLTIAIGALVDDAIVVVDNVYRRLRQEHAKPPEDRAPATRVVFAATSEVLQAVLFATLIIAVVLLPLFLLPGMEGRLLRPLGLAYLAALVASLVVSLTVAPVLCRLLLPRSKGMDGRESWVLRKVGEGYAPALARATSRPKTIMVSASLLFLVTLILVPFMGRSFLPPFNEGSLTVSVVSPPGIPLADSDQAGRLAEGVLHTFPEVASTSRRTGRAEKDEHVQGVNASEIEVVLRKGRHKDELLAAMREAMAVVPGVAVSFGQPISHRIDHMISGSKSNLAVKVFGPELSVLRSVTGQVEAVLSEVPGIVDLSNQEQAGSSQLLVDFDREAMARQGLSVATMARTVEAQFQGTEVGEIIENGVVSRVVVRYPEELRNDRKLLATLPVTGDDGRMLALADLADIRFDIGPSLIRRENVERVAMLTANIEGADLAGTVERARAVVAAQVSLPAGYRIEYGGQFEEGARAVRNLGIAGIGILVAMYLLLYLAFRDHRLTLVVLINLPLALIGGIVAVALGDGVLNVAALVGFITLFGIATRNGVLLVTRYQDLVGKEGVPLEEAIRVGSLERLGPVLMTALTAGLALIPLVLAGGEPGNEIQSPMAQVIVGGLITSTVLNLLVVPVLVLRFGRKSLES